MRLRKLFVLAFVATATLALLTVTACKDSSPEGTEAEAGEKTAEGSASAAEPGPPDDYVRWECGVCSCRTFMGEQADCTRPSCKHHWKDHMRPPQE